mgnify:CR=1 FL=1
MPSFAIPKFIILLGPRWVSADFLLLSTGSLLYIIQHKARKKNYLVDLARIFTYDYAINGNTPLGCSVKPSQKGFAAIYL